MLVSFASFLLSRVLTGVLDRASYRARQLSFIKNYLANIHSCASFLVTSALTLFLSCVGIWDSRGTT